jgi:hypothetical protein
MSDDQIAATLAAATTPGVTSSQNFTAFDSPELLKTVMAGRMRLPATIRYKRATRSNASATLRL